MEYSSRTAVAGPMPEAFTKNVISKIRARHERFLRNKRAKALSHNLQRDDKNGDGVDDIPTPQDGESSDDSSTKSKSITAAQTTSTSETTSSIATTSSSPLFSSDSTTASTVGTSSSSSLLSTTTQPPTSSPTFLITTIITSSTTAPTLAPILTTKTINSNTKASTQLPVSSVIAGGLPLATGLASVANPQRSQGMNGSAITGLIVGLVILILSSIIVVLYVLRRRRAIRYAEQNELEKPSMMQIILGNRRETDRDSRLWGGASSYGGAPSEAGVVPHFVPPSMQKGGIFDVHNQRSSNVISSAFQAQASMPRFYDENIISRPSMPEKVKTSQPRMGEDGLIRPPTRWFEKERFSVVSVPRFRDIKSWARDQRKRADVSEEGMVPAMPSSTYRRL